MTATDTFQPLARVNKQAQIGALFLAETYVSRRMSADIHIARKH